MAINGRTGRKYFAILIFLLSISCALAQTAAINDGPSTRELKLRADG